MTNLEEAKKTLEDNKNLEAIINPQPQQKKIKLPPQRDVNLVQTILEKKLEGRTEQFKERMLNQATAKYQKEIEAIHLKAVALRKEAEMISREIEKDSGNMIKAKFLSNNNYNDGYFGELPETMSDATEHEFFEVEGDKFPQIEGLKREVEDFLLNVKIGMAPIADIKPLLEKIDKILI